MGEKRMSAEGLQRSAEGIFASAMRRSHAEGVKQGRAEVVNELMKATYGDMDDVIRALHRCDGWIELADVP